MNVVSLMATGQNIVILAISALATIASVVALVHAAIQRPDAFPAVDKQSKVIWVSILAAATVFILLFGVISTGLLGIIALASVVAVIVYLVDVRPRVDEIQGRRWFKKA